MKKLPLVILFVIILMVLISGLSDRGRHPGDGKNSELPPGQPEYVYGELYTEFPSSVPGEQMSPNNEKAFLKDNIQKSDEIILRLEDSLKRLESEGNNVSDLGKMLTDYSSLVSDADSYLEKADSADSFSEKQKYVALSKDKMVQSDILLKKIFVDMHNYMPGPVEITANDSLDARGSGVIVLSGNLGINLSLSSGKFSAVDFEGDMVIDDDELVIPGMAAEAVVSTSSDEALHNIVSYVDVQGNVSISGSGMTIAVMGDNTVLHVIGSGEIQFYGNGSYYLDNSDTVKEGVWLSPIFETI